MTQIIPSCFPCKSNPTSEDCVWCFRIAELRRSLTAHGLWTEQSIDEDIIPSITSEDELAEYEDIVYREV